MKTLVSILAMAVMLSSCIYSESPFFTEEMAITDNSFTGKFTSKNDEYIITKAEGKEYDIKVISESSVELYKGTLIKIDENYYADLRTVDHSELPESVHLLLKVTPINNNIKVELLNMDYFTEEMLRTKYDLEIGYADEDYIELNSETVKLYRFLQKIHKDPEAFNEPQIITRSN